MTTHTFDTPTSGESNRPTAVVRFLHAFRHWRKGRPFPAGLLIILAGVELWLAPLSSLGTIIHEGIGGVSAFFIGMLMLMFGLTVWIAPAYRAFAGIASILLGLIALPATNLGGFFLGTLLALIGGGLATSWMPRPGWEAPTRGQRRRMRAAQAQETREAAALDVAAPPSEPPTVAELELAQLEARVHEPGTSPSHAAPPLSALSQPAPSEEAPTVNLPEVENPGATAAERPKG